ncbi:hypothetical protein M407DRAFT_11881 [Tulasnella calospora MUT 4182]|uniref:Uncharacterized protein n=1 Tax=Tulasnella calospora MUT 4182 TaxID=1051891 RepID=A0A0C3Q4Y7_9AGAM|nr:hypothetical protein M407DRAFT_11881 [Tulasnella calospora MUT 4182]
MNKLSGKAAGDPDWPTSGSSRAGRVFYSIVDDDSEKLKVEGSQNEGFYHLKQNATTIIQVVEMLNSIRDRRAQEALDAYDDGLYRYLVSIMRRVSGFYKGSSWKLVARTLSDFESREAAGFKHDLEGRQQWKAWLESSLTPEPESVGPSATNLTAIRGQGRGQIPSSPVGASPSSEAAGFRLDPEGCQQSKAWLEDAATPEPESAGTPATNLTGVQCSDNNQIPASPVEAPPPWEDYGPFPNPGEEQNHSKESEDIPPPVFGALDPKDKLSPRKALTDTLEQLRLDQTQDRCPSEPPSKSTSPLKYPKWVKTRSGAPPQGADKTRSSQQFQQLNGIVVGSNRAGLGPKIVSLSKDVPETHIQQSNEDGQNILNPTVMTNKKGKQKAAPPHAASRGATQQSQLFKENLLGLNMDVLEPKASSSGLDAEQTHIEDGQNMTTKTLSREQKGKQKAAEPLHQTSKGAKKRVAMLSVDEAGLASGHNAPAAKRPKIQSRPREGFVHMLWDVLNEQKNIALGKAAMSDEELLACTRKVLATSKTKDTSKLTKYMKTLGSGCGSYFLPIQGLNTSELEAWNELKTFYMKVNST